MAISMARKAGAADRSVPVAAAPRSLRVLTIQEAAAYGKVSAQTIRRLIKAGMLKTYQLGKQIRIDEADLIALMSRVVLK
jgi:excisionase family DNA binding protein